MTPRDLLLYQKFKNLQYRFGESEAGRFRIFFVSVMFWIFSPILLEKYITIGNTTTSKEAYFFSDLFSDSDPRGNTSPSV